MPRYYSPRKHRRDHRQRFHGEGFDCQDQPDGPEAEATTPFYSRFTPDDDGHSDEPRARIHGRQPRYREEDSAGTPSVEAGSDRPDPYRLRDDSTSSTTDLEMVELRHPEKRFQPGPGHGYRPKYMKSQMTGTRPGTVRASAYSTLSVKSWSELDTEVTTLMRDLNEHFKPIFDKHGPEGVMVKKLQEELNSRRSQHLLGRASIAERLYLADRDGDEYLSYGDFIVMITEDLKQERKLAFRGMLLSALVAVGVLPKEKRDNFLASYTLCPPPFFIPIITIIQVIVFAAYVADMEDRDMEVTANSGYPYYSPLHYSPTRRWQAWRFLTYMFIHDGYLHILYNVVAQLLFGFPLEMVHGWWRTAIIYLTGVAAGSMAHSVVDPGVGLVGASGGVYAILGAHLAAVVTNWNEMNYKLCDQEEFDARPCCAASRFFVSAPFRLALVVLIVVPDTGLAIVRRIALDEDFKVGVSAHVGGFLTGLFLGIPVLKNVKKRAWETNLGWITLVIFLLVCAFAVFFNAFFVDRYPPTDWS